MASVFSHAVAALGIGACFYTPSIPKRVWAIGALCSVVPDLDIIGFHYGIHYGDFWGHRGFTHSLIFAALVAAVALIVAFRRGLPSISRFTLWMYFFLAPHPDPPPLSRGRGARVVHWVYVDDVLPDVQALVWVA